MRTALVAGLLLTIWSLEAHAFCFSPSPPSEPFGSVPGPPFCEVNADYNRCDQFDIDGFKSEIEDYIRKMERYAGEVQSYASEALEYAQCETNDAVDAWNTFVAGY